MASSQEGASGQEAAPSQQSDFQDNAEFNFEEFLNDVIGPIDVNELEKKENDTGKPLWNACILWDGQVMKELRAHEHSPSLLHTTFSLGKVISERLSLSDDCADGYFPSVAEMTWKKLYIMLDIVSDNFGEYGDIRRLRVQQTVTRDSPEIQGKPVMWDLIIDKECESLGNEMVRGFKDGVKTMLVIWGAYRSSFDMTGLHSQQNVIGEIFLRPTHKYDDTLSVLIFHRETISADRRKRILKGDKDSELYDNFQDKKQECSWYVYSNKKVKQVVCHVMKKYKKAADGEKVGDDGVSVSEPDTDVQSVFAAMEY